MYVEYTYTYIDVYIYICMHTYIHTYTLIHTNLLTYTLTNILTYIHTYIKVCDVHVLYVSTVTYRELWPVGPRQGPFQEVEVHVLTAEECRSDQDPEPCLENSKLEAYLYHMEQEPTIFRDRAQLFVLK